MKKILIFISLFLFGSLSFALVLAQGGQFEKDLYFGMSNDSDVTRLQQFLADQGVYDGPITGNFFSLTLAAVKKYQEKNGVSPVSGYFGPKSRAVANKAVTVQPAGSGSVVSSNEQLLSNLNKQLVDLQSQLSSLSASQSTSSTTAVTPAVAATSTAVVSAPVTTATSTVSSPVAPAVGKLKIEVTYPSRTLSSYRNAILTEFKLTSTGTTSVKRIKFKNLGTLADYYLVDLQLINSQTGVVLGTVERPSDGVVEFSLAADAFKADKGLMKSGGTYYISAMIITPGGDTKPTIRLDIESSADITAVDYDDLSREADVVQDNSFPIIGPTIRTF